MAKVDRLSALRVITPCDVPWSSMSGDDQVRHCGKCRKNVYNVARLDHAEALALVERAEGGRVCMRLTYRADGTIATGDCWARLRSARKRGMVAFLAALPIVIVLQLVAMATGLWGLFAVRCSGGARTVAGGITARPPERTMGLPDDLPGEVKGEIKLPAQREHHLMGRMRAPASQKAARNIVAGGIAPLDE